MPYGYRQLCVKHRDIKFLQRYCKLCRGNFDASGYSKDDNRQLQIGTQSFIVLAKQSSAKPNELQPSNLPKHNDFVF